MKQMKRILGVLLAAGLAACGDDSSTSAAPVSGTVAGKAFTQQGQATFFGAGVSCPVDISGTTLNVSASMAVVEVTDYALSCAAATSCALKASSQALTLLIARANWTSATQAPSLVTGNYVFIDPAAFSGGTIPPSLIAQIVANPSIFTAFMLQYGPTCAPTIPVIAQASLSVTGYTPASATSTGSISGTVSIAFQDGGSLSGGFTASTCAGLPAFDACDALGGILGGGGGGAAVDFCGGQQPTCG
jgi:hypothetical protein